MDKEEERLVNFRCNVDLLESFEALCKKNCTNKSKELRLYMEECVNAGEIVERDVDNVKTGEDFRDSLKENIHNIPALW